MAAYRKRDRYRQLYNVLIDAEKADARVTQGAICDATGYQPGTVGAYIRNKLRNVYLFQAGKGTYSVRGMSGVSFASFAYYMSQKSHETAGRDESLQESLRNRAIEAFYAALSCYNNPTSQYRIESFCILACNAWELLLKARIIERERSEEAILRTDGKSISLVRAVERVYPKKSDPTRRNIEKLNAIRDDAVHLLIPDIQNTLSRIFQASVLNFLEALNDFKYPNPHASHLPGLLSLVAANADVEENTIRIKYGRNTADRVAGFLAKTRAEETRISSSRFAIPVDYHVVLTKNAKEGDLRISLDAGGDSVVIIEVPKDHNRTHPYRQKDVIGIVNRRIEECGVAGRINNHSFLGMVGIENIRNAKDSKYYHYIDNPNTHTYSEELIELVVHKVSTNPDYLRKCTAARTKALRAQKGN